MEILQTEMKMEYYPLSVTTSSLYLFLLCCTETKPVKKKVKHQEEREKDTVTYLNETCKSFIFHFFS